MNAPLLKTSTHIFGQTLLDQPESPLRGLPVGRFLILWDGKAGDFMHTMTEAETDEIFAALIATEGDTPA